MARKGKEADVQVFLKTDEEWEKTIEPQVSYFITFKNGLWLLNQYICKRSTIMKPKASN